MRLSVDTKGVSWSIDSSIRISNGREIPTIIVGPELSPGKFLSRDGTVAA
jgi:hypothetical protein